MVSTSTIMSAAARVEQMAQGPVPTPGVIFHPPPGSDPDGPPPEPNVPLLGISLVEFPEPVVGSGSQGVVLVARGHVDFNKYEIKRVDVRFPGAGFVQASLDPLNGWSFTATSQPIKTAGKQQVIARVVADKLPGAGSGSHSDQVIRGVTIELTDDILPVVTINQPAMSAVLEPDEEGRYALPLRVSVSDAGGLDKVEYLNEDGGWQRLVRAGQVWEPSPPAFVPYWSFEQIVLVAATDTKGNTGYGFVVVSTRDVEPPTVTIAGDASISLPATSPGGGATLPVVVGSAQDDHSGVKGVEWALDGSETFQPVTSVTDSAGGRVDWTLQKVAIPPGQHRIRVRARDKADTVAGMAPHVSAVQTLNVTITEKYAPKDPTVNEYFSSLVDFVVRRLTFNGVQVTRSKLGEVLFQPLERLLSLDPRRPAPQVAQLRIGIETLRRYFAVVFAAAPGDATEFAPGAAGDPQPLPPDVPPKTQAVRLRASAEHSYRTSAYQTLLGRLGTSVEELDRALRADRSARRALADRLGVDLVERIGPEGSVLSTLTPFLLRPEELTGARLEELFGLVDLDRDPLEQRAAAPALLELQLARLTRVWRTQDETAGYPVIDPDVVGEDDLRPGAVPATRLLHARRTWLDGLLDHLRARNEGRVPDLARLDGRVARFLAPVERLQELERASLAGQDVTAALDALQLTFPAFARLLTVRRLAEAKAITDTDWEDAYAILIGVQKRRVRERWREAERGLGMHVGPTFFAEDPPREPTSAMSPWRGDPGARLRWIRTLQGRVEQQTALRQALASAVAAAEEEALPVLRDGLMAALAPITAASAATLGNRLAIDVMTGSGVRVTRVEHAIQTLQTLIVGVRTGALPAWGRLPNESQEDFDEELRWMGSYANWYAAMQVFLYPENALQPTLRPPDDVKTSAWSTFLSKLRGPRQMSPDRAASLALAYGDSDNDGVDERIRLRRTRDELRQWREQSAKAIPPGSTDVGRLRAIPAEVKERYYFLPVTLALALHRAGQYLEALDWYRMVYAYDLPMAERKTWHALTLERDPTPGGPLVYERHLFWLTDTVNAHDIVDESYKSAATARYDVHTRFVVLSIVRCLLDFADAEFLQDTNEALPRARSLYVQALHLLALPELNPAKVSELSSSEVIANLRWRAQASLAKLRSGRNLAGFKRQLETVTPVAPAPGQPPLVVSSSPFGSSSLRAFQPTPYRYAALIDRAKQLVSVAQQVEQSYLAAIEKREAEAYNLFKAQQDLALAGEHAYLQTLRVTEAQSQVTLAERQRDRADFQVTAYQNLLDEPMNEWEHRLLDDYKDALEARNWIAGMDAALTIAQSVQSIDIPINPFSVAGAGAVTALAAAKAGLTIDLNNIETDIQRHSLHAAVENRVREWELQKGVAEKDRQIGEQQVQVAIDQLAIITQERSIADLQVTQARAVVAFLANKFTNVELYEWMVDVLQDVYAFFLRQATATAQMAQNQLAFESQEQVPLLIAKDYWQPAGDLVLGDGASSDRRGLTGSARLLQDVYQLDQFAFETTRRKLQLSKTISLARLAPLEFQRFRDTGVLTFATPMTLFDQDFPGHYLRLVKRVTTSVVALVPPQEGIRATLSNPGVSRVVVGGDSFQTVRLTRDPESVALTASANATGVFELQSQPELLLPFELSGVDSIWTLELPKAANPFDFRTLADVLVTIEYTALSSAEHRRRVIAQLDGAVTATRAYSVRDQFPDQWYDLHNPPAPDQMVTVELPVVGRDFPPNVDAVTTLHLALYVVPAGDTPPEPVKAVLRFTPATPGRPPLGGEATSTRDGIVSTRLGNAATWVPMLGGSPLGTYRLTFPDTAAIRALLDRDAVADLALVITYSGRTPAWPE